MIVMEMFEFGIRCSVSSGLPSTIKIGWFSFIYLQKMRKVSVLGTPCITVRTACSYRVFDVSVCAIVTAEHELTWTGDGSSSARHSSVASVTLKSRRSTEFTNPPISASVGIDMMMHTFVAVASAVADRQLVGLPSSRSAVAAGVVGGGRRRSREHSTPPDDKGAWDSTLKRDKQNGVLASSQGRRHSDQ